jgi:putative PIN family toxin of toxin-antitoxin system
MKQLQIVVDTSVVIAAMRSKKGVSSAFLRLLNDSRVKFHISNALLLEYEEVLRREQAALDLTDQDIDDLLDGFCALGEKHYRLFTWRPVSIDPDDDFVLDLALSARVDYLVAYNLRDLQFVKQYGIVVVTPWQVLNILRNRTTCAI